jgi:hypothetical protein
VSVPWETSDIVIPWDIDGLFNINKHGHLLIFDEQKNLLAAYSEWYHATWIDHDDPEAKPEEASSQDTQGTGTTDD